MINFRYLFGAVLSAPLLPFMYYQGKRIRVSVPSLPEATGTSGQHKIQGYSSRLNLISIGESTIAGVGVETHEEGFTGTLAKELSALLDTNVNWKVYARSGYTAKRITYKIIPKIVEQEADLIVMGIGGNDAFKLNKPSQWKEDVRKLIEATRSKFPEAPIVFCNMPPIKEFPAFTRIIKFTVGNLVEILGDELGKTAGEYENVFYFGEKITLEEWISKFDLSASRDAFFSDGVHPSKLTYQTWGKDIANKIHSNMILHKS